MPAKGSTRGAKRTTDPVVLSSSPIKKERKNYYLFGFCFISKIPSNKWCEKIIMINDGKIWL
jgi:hypothetical protein